MVASSATSAPAVPRRMAVSMSWRLRAAHARSSRARAPAPKPRAASASASAPERSPRAIRSLLRRRRTAAVSLAPMASSNKRSDPARSNRLRAISAASAKASAASARSPPSRAWMATSIGFGVALVARSRAAWRCTQARRAEVASATNASRTRSWRNTIRPPLSVRNARRTPSSRWARTSVGEAASTPASRSRSTGDPNTAAVRSVKPASPARLSRAVTASRTVAGTVSGAAGSMDASSTSSSALPDVFSQSSVARSAPYSSTTACRDSGPSSITVEAGTSTSSPERTVATTISGNRCGRRTSVASQAKVVGSASCASSMKRTSCPGGAISRNRWASPAKTSSCRADGLAEGPGRPHHSTPCRPRRGSAVADAPSCSARASASRTGCKDMPMPAAARVSSTSAPRWRAVCAHACTRWVLPAPASPYTDTTCAPSCERRQHLSSTASSSARPANTGPAGADTSSSAAALAIPETSAPVTIAVCSDSVGSAGLTPRSSASRSRTSA